MRINNPPLERCYKLLAKDPHESSGDHQVRGVRLHRAKQPSIPRCPVAPRLRVERDGEGVNSCTARLRERFAFEVRPHSDELDRVLIQLIDKCLEQRSTSGRQHNDTQRGRARGFGHAGDITCLVSASRIPGDVAVALLLKTLLPDVPILIVRTLINGVSLMALSQIGVLPRFFDFFDFFRLFIDLVINLVIDFELRILRICLF